MSSLFKNVTIIGNGLMGSSLARALKRKDLCEHLVLADLIPEHGAFALERGFADEVTTDIPASVENADLVVIAIPVRAYKDLGKQIAGHLKEGTIVSDLGSVKGSVIKDLKKILPATVHFVPGHPIAGTEKSGPEHGFPELFEGRWAVLTPPKDTDQNAVDQMVAMWEGVGSKVEIMTPEHHDLVLGITSHVPHLIAYTIVGTADDLQSDLKSEVIKFSAGGFRDFTRIASQNPIMWRDIFLNNKDAVLEILQRFTEDLTALQRAIRRDEGDVLESLFRRTSQIRHEVIELGQHIAPEKPQKT